MPMKKQRGMALVELGLTLGLLVAIVFGLTEFGRAVYQYDTLAKAARDAARYLSAAAPGDPNARQEATCLAVFGNPSCTGNPLAPGLNAGMVSICDASNANCANGSQGSNPVMNLVTVTIGGSSPLTFTFKSVVPFIVPDIPFGAISVTMRQVL